MKNLIFDGLNPIMIEENLIKIGETNFSLIIGEKKVPNRFYSWNTETKKYDIPCYDTVYFLKNKEEIKKFLKEENNYCHIAIGDDEEKKFCKIDGICQTQYFEYDVGHFDIKLEEEEDFYSDILKCIEGTF